MSDNVIKVWLRYVGFPEYCDSFIDNGYDDLETIKRIKIEDLEAIGVDDLEHQRCILKAVKDLKQKGAAWVYLLYSENKDELEIKAGQDSENYISCSTEQESSLPPSSDETYSDESLSIEKCYSYISGGRVVLFLDIKKNNL